MRLSSRLRSVILLLPVLAALAWLPLASGGADNFPLLWIQIVTFTILAVSAAVGWISFRGPKLFWGAFGLIILGATISTVFSKNLDESVPALLQWFWLGAIALLVVSVGDPERKILVMTLIGAVIIQTFWGFFVWWGGGEPSDTQSGTFYAPNQYAGYLLLLAPLLIAPALTVKPWREAAAWGLMASFICLGVLLSGSRGGLVALGIGLITTIILASRQEGRKVLLRAVLFIATVGLFGLLMTSSLVLNDRLRGSANPFGNVELKGSASPSTQMRIHWVEGAVRTGARFPLTGSGLGTYGDMLVQVQDPSWFWSLYAHNHFAEAFAEGGIILVAGVTALPFFALIGGYKSRRRRKNSEPWLLGLAGGLVAGSAHLFVDHDWSFPAYSVSFLVVATLLVTHRNPGFDVQPSRSLLRPASILLTLFAIVLTLVSVARGQALNLLKIQSDERMVGYEATRFAPYSSDAYARWARELASEGIREALPVLQKAISLDTLNPRLRWEEASMYLDLEEIDLARRSYRDAITVAPNAPASYELAARFELGSGENPASAALVLDQGLFRLKQHPQRERFNRPIAQLLVLRSESAKKLGDSASALAFARAASKHDSSFPEAWLALLTLSCASQEETTLQTATAQLKRLKVPASRIQAAIENCS